MITLSYQVKLVQTDYDFKLQFHDSPSSDVFIDLVDLPDGISSEDVKTLRVFTNSFLLKIMLKI